MKRRISVESLFTLFDEANSITHSIEFENTELKRQLNLNKVKIEMDLKKKLAQESKD